MAIIVFELYNRYSTGYSIAIPYKNYIICTRKIQSINSIFKVTFKCSLAWIREILSNIVLSIIKLYNRISRCEIFISFTVHRFEITKRILHLLCIYTYNGSNTRSKIMSYCFYSNRHVILCICIRFFFYPLL